MYIFSHLFGLNAFSVGHPVEASLYSGRGYVGGPLLHVSFPYPWNAAAMFLSPLLCAGILKQSMGARNRVGIEL